MARRFVLLAALGILALLGSGDEGRVPRDVRTERFATSVVCRTCHGNRPDSGAMRDGIGRGIAPYDLWRGSMMANAARDPFFRAAVAAEAAAAPGEEAAVEARCLHCHAPMASFEERLAGRPGLALADLERETEHEDADRAALARDGVSCTLCHQIAAENLGTPAGFGGGFVVGDEREIFGPFDDQLGLPMHRVTKYWPVKGEHFLDSAVCATCHVASLPGGALELATYQEWRNSSHADASTCQGCHVPVTGEGGGPIRTRISSTSHGGDILALAPRAPVGRHLFVGGNTLLPAILRDHAEELHAKAPAEAFDFTIAAARDQLRERTARVAIEDARKEGASVHVVVSVTNLAGHKFPTGHASRRAWLRVQVLDKEGRVVFESGATDAEGRLRGSGGTLASEAAGGPVAPHRTAITSPDEVQVYEAVLAGADGRPVFLAGPARGFSKDNRLLPAGWRGDHADAAATKPHGVGGDADFGPGGDRISYTVPFPEDHDTFTVSVELLYQPLSPRYAAELFRTDHPEVARFRGYYEKADRAPEVVARDLLVGGPQ